MTAETGEVPVTVQRLWSAGLERCDFISLSLLARWTG